MAMKIFMRKCMILTIFIHVLLDFVKPNERWIHIFHTADSGRFWVALIGTSVVWSDSDQVRGAKALGLRRAVRRVHKSPYGRAFFVKIGTHTKFDLGNNPLGLFLLFGAN